MSIRKVQKVGKSTFTVSLPQEWVKKNMVQAQTEVDIQTLSDGNLKISTLDGMNDHPQNREITIATKESDAGYLVREALAAYIANYDIIKLDLAGLTLDPSSRNKIRRMIKYKMAGGEIIEESVNNITIQILLRPYEFPLDKLLMRMATMVKDMLSDVTKAIDKKDRNILKDVMERDEDVDKLYFMGCRWLTNIMSDMSSLKDYGVRDVKDCLEYRLAFRHIERVADHVYKIAGKFMEVVEGVDAELAASIINNIESAGSAFIRSVNCLQNGSLAEANKAIHDARKVSSSVEELMKRVVDGNLQTKVIGAMIIVMDSTNRIAEYAIGIAELAFNVHVSA